MLLRDPEGRTWDMAWMEGGAPVLPAGPAPAPIESCVIVSDGMRLGIQEKRNASLMAYTFPSYLTLLTRWPGVYAPWYGVGQGAVLTLKRNRTGGTFKWFKCTGLTYTTGHAEAHAVIID